MKRTNAFGGVLEEIRRAQGYATPYAFYRSRGGRRGLGLTFPNYLSLERGENLPKGWRLKRLLDALGLLPHSEAWRRLVRTYLVDLVGAEDLIEGLEGPRPASDPAPSALRLAGTASRQLLSLIKVQLDLSQYGVLAKDATAYGCHVLLCNTYGGLEEKELSARTGAAPGAVRKAVAALEAAGMAKRSIGRVRSAFEDKFLQPPAPTPALAGLYSRMAEHRAEWAKRGAAVHAPYLLARLRRSEAARYLEHLTEVVHISAAFAETRPAQDSDVYLVEGKLTRLFAKPGDGKS